MTANEGSNVFSTSKKQTAFKHVILICKKMNAKVRQCLSDDLSIRNCNARDLLFTFLGYRILRSRHVPYPERIKQQKNEQVEEAKARLSN